MVGSDGAGPGPRATRRNAQPRKPGRDRPRRECDLTRALDNVKTYSSYHSWTVVDIQQDTGSPSPIRAGDPHALGQRAYYGWAWAAYPAADGAG